MMTIQSSAEDGGTTEVPAEPRDALTPDADRADIIGILDTIDVPILVVRRDFTVARFNRAATTALHLTSSNIGQSPRDIRVLREAKDLAKLCAQVIADGAPRRCDIRDGDRSFLLRIAPYTAIDRQIGGVVLTLTNVTAFRASIEQAIYEREYTKAILNTVREPLVVLDADLRVQTANRAFYAMFRVSREDAHGIPLSNLGNQDWQTSHLWASLKKTLSENSEFPIVELNRDFPAIGHRTVLLDARPLSRKGDALILLVFQDITERKRAEAQICRLLSEAEQRERELREKQAQLVQSAKLASLGELAAGIAHEVNNPLNNIGLFVGNAVDHLKQEALDREKILHPLTIALQQVSKAATIIAHLRTFARAAGVDRQPLSMNPLIRSALSLMQDQLRLRNIDVTVDLSSHDATVLGNALQLEQVFINLLTNARDAVEQMPRKGITIASVVRGDQLDITVQDTGIGVPADLQPRIFDPFFTTKEVGKGTGLGLSISYGIIQEHGGQLLVETPPDTGARFRIRLPLAME